MSSSRRLRVPALLIAAVTALLVFAATAAAEVRTGESTTPFALGPSSPETTFVKAASSYDTTAGNAVFNITTAAAPQAAPGGEESTTMQIVILGTSSGECSSSVGTLEALILGGGQALIVENAYASPTPVGFYGSIGGLEGGGGSGLPVPTTKSVAGTTTTLSSTSAMIAEKTFNCAAILMEGEEGESFIGFPIKAPPPPPPAPTPPPAPPVLSVAKPSPLKLKTKAWKTVHVKVSNTGATATTQGSLRVKPAKGVLVKPEVQKLPILTPGATFTLSVRVQLTEKAKSTSKLPVTVTAPGVTATSSIVLKLKK